MPSTPRMIELERKASTPGEGLSRAEVSEWHRLNARSGYLDALAEIDAPLLRADLERVTQMYHAEAKRLLSSDYRAADRYLDAPAYKARHNG